MSENNDFFMVRSSQHNIEKTLDETAWAEYGRTEVNGWTATLSISDLTASHQSWRVSIANEYGEEMAEVKTRAQRAVSLPPDIDLNDRVEVLRITDIARWLAHVIQAGSV